MEWELKMEYLAMRREMKQGYGRHSFEKADPKDRMLSECFKLVAKTEQHSHGNYNVRLDIIRDIERVLDRKTHARTAIELSKEILKANYEQLIQIKNILSRP